MAVRNDQWLGIELRHLAALEAVAREGSFRRAATRLGYVQSAISQQIATLEEIVGARLVERSRGPQPLTLTDAGERLLAHSGAIVARLHAARADLASLLGGETGTLSVGIGQSVGVRILPSLMQRFSAEWPEIRIQPSEAETDLALYALIESGELDLSFVELPLPPGPFEAVELLEDPHVLVVRSDSPLARRAEPPTLAEIAALPLIGHTQCRGLKRIEAQLRGSGTEPNVIFRSDVNATVQALVASGLGVAVLPLLFVDPADERTSCIDIGRQLPPRRLAMVWHRDRHQSGPAQAFLEAAQAVCAEIDAARRKSSPARRRAAVGGRPR